MKQTLVYLINEKIQTIIVFVIIFLLFIEEVKMIAPYFPAILIPIIGIFLPGIAMGALFVLIEKESVE
jgi:hypothetical protein